MRRVLKPTGRVAFVTWPPEHLVGRMFSLIGRNSPPPPPGVCPAPALGKPSGHPRTAGGRVRRAFLRAGHDGLSGLESRSLSPVYQIGRASCRERVELAVG